MSPPVQIDPYIVKKAEEWLTHKKLVAAVENLGKPVFKIPEQTWGLPSSVFIAIDSNTLQKIAINQIDEQIKKIEEQIEGLKKIKSRFAKFRDEV